MDAHTLNAWTRFALQKGGIGSCTALIDNPATEPEDLMFMAGEKIIVLRRLDEDGADANDRPNSLSAKRKSNAAAGSNDAASWFLGYCEGVVGRFRGAHVQFHGRLKKPVLMRRSGMGSQPDVSASGSLRDDEVALSSSQLPRSIPVAAVESDEDEDTRDTLLTASTSRATLSPPKRGPQAHIGSSSSPRNYESTHREGSSSGVSTPPLSDEGHQYQMKSLRAALDEDDSDDSSSMLPWARHSRHSSAASDQRAGGQGHQQTGSNSTDTGQDTRLRLQGIGSSHLPPSPISSSESPIAQTTQEHPAVTGAEADAKADKYDGERNSRTSSTYTTSATDDSDDETPNHRRDYAFSIYDVYGRDSVAFPNFNFREAYAGNSASRKRMSRIAASKSSESLAAQASTEPLPPSPHLATHRVADPGGLSSASVSQRNPGFSSAEDANRLAQSKLPSGAGPATLYPTALCSASGRRPSAAPDPRLPGPGMGAAQNLASSLRRQVEATGSPTLSGGHFPDGLHGPGIVPPTALRAGPVSFDPRRRPSAGNLSAPSMTSASPASPTDSTRGPFSNPHQAVASPTLPISELSSPSIRRPSFAESRERRRSNSASKMQITLVDSDSATSPPDIAGGPGQNDRDLPSPVRSRPGTGGSPALGPMRASSDRLSERDRINSGSGSGMLRKNPSNPTPGLYGGISVHGLAPLVRVGGSPKMALGVLTSSDEGHGRKSSDARSAGTAPRSPIRSPISDGLRTPTRTMQGALSISFDPLGFVNNGGTMIPQVDDPESREKWLALFNEDDSASVRKSRKVKRLVRQGIPPSVRGQAWLFLANASVRRRVGLFEQLCKASQGSKGKKGKEALYDAIEKDLDRSFPDHRLFMGEAATGKADLEAILKSYVHFNPVIGYTQGMGLLAGLAMIHMPPEDAFWLLCAALRDPHMEGYYTPTMKQLHVDSVVLGNLLRTMDQQMAQRFDELGIEPIMFTPSWFLPLFTRIVPWQTLIRLWDIFFFEGPSWLLRVALAVIRIIREPLMRTPGHGEMLQMLLHPPHMHLTPDNVLNCAFSVKLKDGEMRKLSRQASKLVRENTTGRGRADDRRGSMGSRSTSAPARR
ncbi:hypothetical protein ACQY0O_002262 [Thecaphora frezii]|nr:putative tbc1 domain family member 10b [Thecaphora frezii]